MRARMKKTVLLAVLAGTLGFVVFDFARVERSTRPSNTLSSDPHALAGSSPQAAAAGAPVPLALPERSKLGELRTQPFASRSWQPRAPKISTAPLVPPAPTAPPMPYRYVGKLVLGGQPSVLLAKGDTVFPVTEGETLDGAYRVESVGETEITLMYLPLALEERIPVDSSLPVAASATRLDPAAAAGGGQAASTTAAPVRERGSAGGAKLASQSRPAQLLWEGPPQVKLGTRFEAILRVTSDQPLQASPMQLRFDPAYLELVAVKPGKFLDSVDRNFSYRANPDGSIFVGASIQNPASASGAELLVLTFRTVKTAAAAELSIASLNLQGAAGQAVAFSQPAAFKIAISP